MPFKSQAQRAWMHANKPEMAKEWEAATPRGSKLPDHIKSKATTTRPAKKYKPPARGHQQ